MLYYFQPMVLVFQFLFDSVYRKNIESTLQRVSITKHIDEYFGDIHA